MVTKQSPPVGRRQTQQMHILQNEEDDNKEVYSMFNLEVNT